MMTPADKGLLREIWWCVDPAEDEGGPLLVATLAQRGGITVLTPLHGDMDHWDWLVLTDRITRFFLVIHGSHMFPEAP